MELKSFKKKAIFGGKGAYMHIWLFLEGALSPSKGSVESQKYLHEKSSAIKTLKTCNTYLLGAQNICDLSRH